MKLMESPGRDSPVGADVEVLVLGAESSRQAEKTDGEHKARRGRANRVMPRFHVHAGPGPPGEKPVPGGHYSRFRGRTGTVGPAGPVERCSGPRIC